MLFPFLQKIKITTLTTNYSINSFTIWGLSFVEVKTATTTPTWKKNKPVGRPFDPRVFAVTAQLPPRVDNRTITTLNLRTYGQGLRCKHPSSKIQRSHTQTSFHFLNYGPKPIKYIIALTGRQTQRRNIQPKTSQSMGLLFSRDSDTQQTHDHKLLSTHITYISYTYKSKEAYYINNAH